MPQRPQRRVIDMDWTMLSGILAFTIASTLRGATPLIFAAIGGVFSERSGGSKYRSRRDYAF